MRALGVLVFVGLLVGTLPGAAQTTAVPPGPKKTPELRIWSRGYTTWIWSEPKKRLRGELGYIRVGESVAITDKAPRRGPGCAGGYYAVEPRGFVCLDQTATLDGNDRYVQAMQHAQPSSRPLPFRYALSNGAPMYRRLPTRAEWEKHERWLGAPGTHGPLSWGNRGHELLAEKRALRGVDPLPSFLRDRGSAGSAEPLGVLRRQIPLGSMLAYTRSFEHDGRTWLLSTDLTLVPADRVRPYRESTFQGLRLGRGVELPLAWIRATARPKYRRSADGSAVRAGSEWPARTAVALDSNLEPITIGKQSFLSTRERDRDGAPLLIAETDATVVRARDALPFVGTDRDKWIVISITNGTLVAYEGLRPVFTTLVSPGAGGVPIPGKDPVRMSTTPLGVYRVNFKHRAATMSPEKGEDRSFWIADVPHTQYFNAPFALHTAYWHENFGEPMSAGCINLSPRDGVFLFEWTDPQVPRDWAGAAGGGKNGPGTFVVVFR